MKLTKRLKKEIDDYFDNISPEEFYKKYTSLVMTKRRYYTEKSDFYKRVEDLFDKMEELGLSIENTGSEGFRIFDNKGNDAIIKNFESDEGVPSLPSAFEYRLVVNEELK